MDFSVALNSCLTIFVRRTKITINLDCALLWRVHICFGDGFNLSKNFRYIPMIGSPGVLPPLISKKVSFISYSIQFYNFDPILGE